MDRKGLEYFWEYRIEVNKEFLKKKGCIGLFDGKLKKGYQKNFIYASGASYLNGCIDFVDEKDLRSTPIFMVYYNNFSKEYKQRIDQYIKVLAYTPMNYARGHRFLPIKRVKVEVLETFFALDSKGFDCVEHLKGEQYFNFSYVQDLGMSWVFAAEFKENKEFVSLFKKMVYDNENTQNLSKELIAGAIMSNEEEVIQAIEDLLRAAKLSEGLRSSIINYIDHGSLETYHRFLKIIQDEKMQRFSSVRHAFANFVETHFDDAKGYEKLSEYVIDCVLNQKSQEYLDDENPLKVYVGLYSLSIVDTNSALKYIKENIQKAKKHRRAAFIYYLTTLKFKVNSVIITQCLKTEEDTQLKAFLLNSIPEIRFENNEAKVDYIYAFLGALKSVKPNTKYRLFQESSLRISSFDYQYNRVLELVKEVSEGYEEAYSIFGQYQILADPSNVHGDREFTYVDELFHPAQREALIRGLSSSKSQVRKKCYELMTSLSIGLTEDEYFELAKLLKSKRGDLRSNICNMFKVADSKVVIKAINYLIEQKEEELRSGGLSIFVDNQARLSELPDFKVLQDKITAADFSHEYKDLKQSVEEIEPKEQESFIELDVPKLTYDQKLVDRIMNYDLLTMKQLIEACWKVIENHYGEEVKRTSYDGTNVTQIVGSNTFRIGDERYNENIEKKYQTYDFYEEFLEVFKEVSDEDIVFMQYMTKIISRNIDFLDKVEYRVNDWQLHAKYDMVKDFFKHKIIPNVTRTFNDTWHKREKMHETLYNFNTVLDLVETYRKEELGKDVNDSVDYNKILLNYLAYAIQLVKKREKSLVQVAFDGECSMEILNWVSDFVLKKRKYFDDEYALDILKNMIYLGRGYNSPVEIETYAYFLDKGLLPKKYIEDKLVNLNWNFKHEYGQAKIMIKEVSIRLKTYKNHRHMLEYADVITEVYGNAVRRIIELEFKRTDSETKYTKILSELSIFYDVELFARVLNKMKKVDFVRAYNFGNFWMYSTKTWGIKEIFSKILASIIPEQDLTNEEFKRQMQLNSISDKKILEAGLYNSYFAKYCAEYLNIQGLEKAMYYFKAHSLTDVHVSSEMKTMINRYSSFELEDFVDGKMDIKWFDEIQEEMNPEDYKKVYDASRFIMDSTKRKRGQYFSDAVLGNLKVEEVENRINGTRNQDMLLCYGLIPLGKNKEKEAVRRYKRIQLFLKEAKQFGAKRRATETRVGQIAISNLAINYGVELQRFIWIMEANLIDEINPLFEPTKIGEIEVHLSLECVHKPEVIACKSGKRIKSIPKKYQKDEYILKLKAAKKEIKEQYSRAKKTLEDAMVNSAEFDYSEMTLIFTHPLLKELAKDLLFIKDDIVGFFKENKLVDSQGNEYPIDKQSTLRIAHSSDLIDRGWIDWQQYLLKNGIVQPFKQVFRELYQLTKDELENDGMSQRFAGYQIERKKAFALLNSRNWLDLYGEGFEKVNHAHNLRIDLYYYRSVLDPNEIEEETIEKVVFMDNKTGKTKDMKKLDKILFSETMRDLDLVVSVAYVGGVDPLLNHTTLEMRKRIIEHNLSLFKIENTKFLEKHIVVEGSLGKYSIHLGSGVVSAEGKGMIPIMPVHSQRRGHIFLPFVDDDPKTAEIISKVIMLAEDKKLKDPTILQFLK